MGCIWLQRPASRCGGTNKPWPGDVRYGASCSAGLSPGESPRPKLVGLGNPAQLQHSPTAFRIYASDEDVDDVDRGEIHNAAHALWRAEHIDERDAAAVIKCAVDAVRAAQEQLDNAVLRARQAGLSWARIGEAANMSPQAAH